MVLVDDTADLRQLMRTPAARGWDVVGEVGDGVQGIEVARRRRPTWSCWTRRCR